MYDDNYDEDSQNNKESSRNSYNSSKNFQFNERIKHKNGKSKMRPFRDNKKSERAAVRNNLNNWDQED